MTTFSVSRSFTWQGEITEKVASVCRMFGLTADRLAERRFTYECQLEVGAGEKYRFRLAMALGAGKQFVFADEFCSELDRIAAAVISSRLHKFAKRTGATFILASSHQDILLDLEPDILVVNELLGPAEVIYKSVGRLR